MGYQQHLRASIVRVPIVKRKGGRTAAAAVIIHSSQVQFIWRAF
jgi:hypothetical protein